MNCYAVCIRVDFGPDRKQLGDVICAIFVTQILLNNGVKFGYNVLHSNPKLAFVSPGTDNIGDDSDLTSIELL